MWASEFEQHATIETFLIYKQKKKEKPPFKKTKPCEVQLKQFSHQTCTYTPAEALDQLEKGNIDPMISLLPNIPEMRVTETVLLEISPTLKSLRLTRSYTSLLFKALFYGPLASCQGPIPRRLVSLVEFWMDSDVFLEAVVVPLCCSTCSLFFIQLVCKTCKNQQEFIKLFHHQSTLLSIQHLDLLNLQGETVHKVGLFGKFDAGTRMYSRKFGLALSRALQESNEPSLYTDLVLEHATSLKNSLYKML